MSVGILAIRLTGRGIERFELLGIEFLVGYHYELHVYFVFMRLGMDKKFVLKYLFVTINKYNTMA